MLITVPFGTMITTILARIFPGIFGINLNVDENLPNYFDAVDQNDKNWSIKEEENMRREYVSYLFIFILV